MPEQTTGTGGLRRASLGGLLALGVLALGSAPAEATPLKLCRHEHLFSRDATGQTLPVTNLRVDRLSCASAATAVRASTFQATPGGPIFSTPGFTCTGPVGPPPPRSKPRYYRCTRGREEFAFLVAGFS